MTKPKRPLPQGRYEAKISDVVVGRESVTIKARVPAMGAGEVALKTFRLSKPKRRHR